MTKHVLGIETSCDETAAAVVCNYGNLTERICSHVVKTQLDEHRDFGGVVPEVAARAHMELLFPILKKTLDQANLSLSQVDAIAATCGPGLLGGVMVGAMAAKTLAMVLKKPFIAVNHLEGHAQVCRLTDAVEFPYLLLLVSGGHCQFLEVYGLGQYHLLGTTLDDSAGEAFDKIARLLDLGYPGGPWVEKYACEGDAHRFEVPIPLKGKPGCDLSFSGLKTAFRILIQQHSPLSNQDRHDFAASAQECIAQALAHRTESALRMVSEAVRQSQTLVIAGGVAANRAVREKIQSVADRFQFRVVTPPPSLCTDNAVMIAWVGLCLFLQGHQDPLSASPRPRWPLGEPL